MTLDSTCVCHYGVDAPNGVFKAVVRRAGENKVGPSELLEVSQSLELRCVDDFDEEWVQLHLPVDGIVEHLAERQDTRRQMYTQHWCANSAIVPIETENNHK